MIVLRRTLFRNSLIESRAQKCHPNCQIDRFSFGPLTVTNCATETLIVASCSSGSSKMYLNIEGMPSVVRSTCTLPWCLLAQVDGTNALVQYVHGMVGWIPVLASLMPQ